ncbi:Uncharacterised protein [Sphingobacterium thalpophilum]|uniref:Lipoprotein n=1 Tax=Sphingobacterium thalpophilum TaxID=259 RepID=A0A4U9W2E0_9SPHI|nr:Uncharacterised protein [Sphingobacterium thalpophilum]
MQLRLIFIGLGIVVYLSMACIFGDKKFRWLNNKIQI